MHHNNVTMMSQQSVQDELANVVPTVKLTSELKSDLKQGSSNDPLNKEGYLLSGLNSENKTNPTGHKQSFMNKLGSTVPLLKDVSFGGAHSSLGVISGLPSTSTKNG